MNRFLSKKEKVELEQDLHSVPMTIILKLKKQLNFLMVLILILVILLAFSFYDSIRIRDEYWQEHTQEVVEVIHEHCEQEQWQN
jgi:choline-glycine betaine transporter